MDRAIKYKKAPDIKKSVLIICPFFPPNIGGVETHLDDLCTYLIHRKFRVYVLTYQPLTTNIKAPRFEKYNGLEIHRIKWPGYNLFDILEPYPILEILYLTPRLFIETFFFVLNKKNIISVIHAHGLNAAFIASVIGKLFKIKTVVSIHAIYNLSKRWFIKTVTKKVLNCCDKILCLGEFSRREFVQNGVKKEKVFIYKQWVKQDRIFKPYDKKYCREKLNIFGDFITLFTGRFIERKGVRLLLEVTKEFSEDVKFIFIGDGPLRKDVVLMAKRQKNIVYFGRKKQDELPLFYCVCDVVIIPSEYEEGYARVVLESLSCGRPLIAANRGCLKEMLDQSVAILLEPTVENIKNAIVQLHSNHNLLKHLTTNCRPYALKHFSVKNADDIIAHYF